MPNITKRFIDSLKIPKGGAETFYWDDKLKGFGIRCKPSGVASYLIQYRTIRGATRRLTLARLGTVTPEEARTKAKRAFAAVADGKDPSAERKAERAAKTFGEFVEVYQGSDGWKNKSEGARAIDQGRIDWHLLPLIGNRALDALTRREMERVFRDIRDGRTAVDKPSGKKRGRIRVRGGEGTARRTLGLASAIFSFAVGEELLLTNPCLGIDKGQDGTRDTIVEDADGHTRLFRALDNPLIPRAAADAIRLIALTGARRGEIVGLTWGSVDLRNGRLVIQRTKHKTGRKTGKAKVIPLPARAQEIIAAIKAGKPDEFVIRSAKKGARIDLKKIWVRVRASAGLPADLTMHGLRHTIASHLAMDGASGPQIKQAMGHASIKTSERYIHFSTSRRNDLAEQAATHATAGLAASRGEATGEVITGRFSSKAQ
jgi:integrase